MILLQPPVAPPHAPPPPPPPHPNAIPVHYKKPYYHHKPHAYGYHHKPHAYGHHGYAPGPHSGYG